MRFRDDNRGVTVQIGAVLLFATLIMALAVYQATVVPAQNADIEYKHSQEVQSDLVDVRNSLLTAAASGSSQPVSMDLGMNYPSRVFLMNPSPPAGTLETRSYADSSIRLSNVQATDNETRDFIDGSWSASTKFLAYEPDYNEYRSAPTLLYEASILSNYYPDVDNGTAVPLTGQVLVDNETRTISLVSLNGTLSTSQSGAASVSPEALSAPSRRVQVEPANTGAPVELSVPTKVSAAVLRNSTSLGDHPGVVDVTDHPTDDDRVVITVEWDEPFVLQTAMVGVGSDTTDPGPHYVTVAEHRDGYVTLEVRDRFNNPETGVPVSVASGGSVLEDASTKRTGTEGQVTFGAADGESGAVEFEIEDGSEAREVAAVSLDAAGDGATGNGTTPLDTLWDTAAIASQTGIEYLGANDTVVINASNSGTPSPASFTASVTNDSGAVVADVTVDYGTTNRGVLDFLSSTQATATDGRSTVDANYNPGTATVYASGGGDTDALNVKVVETDGAAPTIHWRVVDLSANTNAGYRVEYDVEGAESSFDRVRITYDNQQNSWADSTNTVSDSRSTDTYSTGGTMGATYEITIEALDADGNVLAERSLTDEADGTNPTGDDQISAMREPDSPSLGSVTVTDRSQNTNAILDLAYEITGGQTTYQETRITFLNTNDGNSGTETRTSRDTTVTYDEGGDMGDTYEITTDVVDDDGITVARNVKTEVADGSDGGGGGGGSGNAQNVEVQQVQINNGQIDIQFRNNNAESVTFTQARLDSYSEANSPGNPNVDPIDRVVYQPGQGGPELVAGDPLEAVSGPTISNGGNGGVTFQPRRVDNRGGGSVEDANAEQGDTVTFTIEFSDGSTAQYTVTL